MRLLLRTVALLAPTIAFIPAHAAVFPITVTQGSNFFGNEDISNGTNLSDSFTFNLADNSFVDSALITVSLNGNQNIDFTSVLLDGHPFTQTSPDPTEVWSLPSTFFSAGPKTILVNYNASGTTPDELASYSGVLNVAPAVPEPATWALMIGGFGLIGAAMRRRRTHVRVSYA